MPRPKKVDQHLSDKYKELVWALSFQDYSQADIGRIMNRTRTAISRVVGDMPRGWKPKWTKVE